MTTDELNAIVQAVMTELEKAGVDFDFKAEVPQPTDLVYVMRGTADKYQGITVKWQNLLDLIVKNATDAKNEAVSAKDIALQTLATIQGIESNVSTMKSSVETTKGEVEALKSDVATMKASVETSEARVTQIKAEAEQTLAEATQTVTGKADKTYVDGELAKKADVTYVDGKLANKSDKSELAVERARIDNLSKLSEGSTTGDAELIDLRIGADGVTYGNAGTAVRTQINNLKGDLDDIKSPSGINIWDEEWELGNIDLDGSIEPFTTRIRSKNFIPCNPSENYYFFTNGYSVFVFYYNNNYEYVGRNLGTNNDGVKNEIIKTPASAKYIKFRWNDDYGVKYKHDASINADMSEKYNPYYTAYDIVSRNAVAETNKRIDDILEAKPKAFDFMRFENVNAILNGGQAIQDNIITRNGYQFCCYVNGENKVCIAKRSVDNHEWVHRVIDAFPVDVKVDGHYYLSMGMDNDGHIHLCGGMHCSPLQYVRTATPYDINSFFRQANMISSGDNESEVSYPCFVNKKDGGLLFFYRSGGSGETYNYVVNAFVCEPNNHEWRRLSINLISGNHTDGYPYLNHIVVDKDGKIHISGCWRANENYDVFYMVNDGNGTQTSWKKSDGTPYDSFPITRENAEKICDISTIDNGLLNQNGMCVDENNIPHIVYFRLDENNKTNIFHLYKNGSNWIEQKVTEFDYKVEPNLTSYEGQLSRPSIFCYNNRLYLIYRHNYDGLNGKLRLRDITEYPKYKETVIFDGELGAYEASYDTNSINNGELNILVCEGNTNINESIPIDIRYNEIDWAKKPICGVISINLTRIDEVMNNECKVPLVMPITSGSSIIVKGGSKHFIKLCVCRNSKEEAKASAIMIENGTEKVLGSVYLYSSDSEMVKESNFLLLENNSDCIVKVKNDTSNIEFAYIVEAELIF